MKKISGPIGILPSFVGVGKVEKTPFNLLVSPGGPVISSNEEECLKKMLSKVKEICEENSLVSHSIIAKDERYVRYAIYFSNEGYNLDLGTCKFIVPLNRPFEELKDNFSGPVRRNLRKAAGIVEIEEEADLSKVHEFYDVYRRVIHQRSKLTPFPFSFFKKVIEHLGEKMRLFTARKEGRIVGGMLFFG